MITPEQQKEREWAMRPNLLPPDHTREDFDFQQGFSEHDQNGKRVPGTEVMFMAPFRLTEFRDEWGILRIPQKVWCKKHFTWEDELFEEAEGGEQNETPDRASVGCQCNACHPWRVPVPEQW